MSNLSEEGPPSSSLTWRELSQISITDNRLSYTGRRQIAYLHEDVGLAIGRYRFSKSRRYFEILIEETGKEVEINIGAVPKDYPLDRFPGWNAGSTAYHADDGFLFDGVVRSHNFCEASRVKLGICGQGDRMGCGVRFEGGDLARGSSVTVFFTKNGYEVGCSEQKLPLGGLYPSIGLRSISSEVQTDMTSFESVPPLKDICRSCITANTNFYDVEYLPIPKPLKKYLKHRLFLKMSLC